MKLKNLVDPVRSSPKVELINPTEWFKPLPSTETLAIRWNKEDLGWSRNETVDVQLFGYYEDDEGPHWDFLQVRFLFLCVSKWIYLALIVCESK